MNDPDDVPENEDPWGGRPSRSARKREAEGLQKFGEWLLTLRESELRALGLPENLLEALLVGQNVRSGPAQARQKQYIGKLMRSIDVAALETALAARPEQQRARAKIRR
ncbi:MAG TPA: ribosome biogenesis factor YjgA [Steroidobacteraceae bacterium]|nr:ribosome biogenesis factor YjgA [Steroidobacteraceae bacterium]